MNIYCKDYDGHEIVNPSFAQWDTGQVLYASDVTYDTDKYAAPWFHFSSAGTQVATCVEAEPVDDGVYCAQIPDLMLRQPYMIRAMVYLPSKENGAPSKTIGCAELRVVRRPPPA